MARFATPPTTWPEVLAGYPDHVQRLVAQLRAVVGEALPDATESIGGARMMGYAQYWMDDRHDVVAMISPEDAHVKLYMHHVRKDESGRLKVEGTGKNARHVKLTSIDEDAVRAILQQALAGRAKARA